MPGDVLICVDFDDTLVSNQEHFARALEHLARLLAAEAGAGPAKVAEVFSAVDREHDHRGRHRNRFLVTVFATYCAVTGRSGVPLEMVPDLAAISAIPYDALPEPVAGAPQALTALRKAGTVYLVTAGDPVTQPGRVQRSGLAPLFDGVHVVPEKTPEVYRELRAGYDLAFMIGNAARTDILPALAAEFAAIHVQAPTWDLDDLPLPSHVPSLPGFPEAARAVLGMIHPGRVATRKDR